MSSDMCSLEEERLHTIMVLRWREIISKSRTGNVTDIPIDCEDPKLKMLRNKTQLRLDLIEDILKNIEPEFADTKKHQEKIESKCQPKLFKLSISLQFPLCLLLTMLICPDFFKVK